MISPFVPLVDLVFLVAFLDSSLLSCHFWPFTEVLGRIWRFVTRKVRGIFIGERRLPACRFRLLAEMHLAMHNRRTLRSVRGKLPRTTGRRPVLPGRLPRREGGDDFFEARIAAQRIFPELWNFQVSCSSPTKISSLAGRTRTGL